MDSIGVIESRLRAVEARLGALEDGRSRKNRLRGSAAIAGPSVAVPADTMPAGGGAFTIPAFCRAHGISRSTLYGLWQAGDGPDSVFAGTAKKRRLITYEFAARWRQRLEQDACDAAERQMAEAGDGTTP